MIHTENTGNTLSRRIYSVSEFSGSLSQELAEKFPSVCVRGEVTNLSKPRSGHWYFSLKDEDAQIRVVMFRGSNLRAHQIKEGEEVIACGKPGIYKDRGDLQLIASHLQLAGAGDLQKQFEELKKQLQFQGYFDSSNKKPIPDYPGKAALITSPSGAVIHDIQTVTSRRAPALPLLLLPTNVQGPEAVESIVQAIQVADERQDIELILLARGGGSLEDFAAFNSQEVAKSIFDCNTPVICAVGHESDLSIADLVADLRAATPSVAAEIMTEGYLTLRDRFNERIIRARQALERRLQAQHKDLLILKNALQDPNQEIRQAMQKLDSLEPLLESRLRWLLEKKINQLSEASSQINLDMLKHNLAKKQQALINAQSSLCRNQQGRLQQAENRFGKSLQLLDALSPLAVLKRGYGITEDTQGQVISSISQLSEGQAVKTRLEDGIFEATVTGTTVKENEYR